MPDPRDQDSMDSIEDIIDYQIVCGDDDAYSGEWETEDEEREDDR